jgi:transcriptional regulator with XRE-family HTH domain
MSKKVFADNIRKLQRQHRLMNEQVVEEMSKLAKEEIGEYMYRKWKEGACYPRVDKLLILAEVFKYPDLKKLLTQPITEAELNQLQPLKIE